MEKKDNNLNKQVQKKGYYYLEINFSYKIPPCQSN